MGIGRWMVAQGGRIRSEVAVEKEAGYYYHALLMLLIRIQRELLISQCYRRLRCAEQFRQIKIRSNLETVASSSSAYRFKGGCEFESVFRLAKLSPIVSEWLRNISGNNL